uniref:NADH-ubiquinone oxidoreductase chain 2 n=1 Tax=Pristurus rupestris rupestris TaxID=1530261 RepID=A0A343SA17_9SAUR|nr:NADH dehydrogenase subunit 2 [Pristurus rupestris rupestris]
MNPALYSLFLLTLFSSTLITLASNHWLLAWLGLELNTLAVLPLISSPHHPRATEATTKYFMAQTTASTIILLTGTITAWHTGQWTISNLTPPSTTVLLIAAIMLKLGTAPLHFWYPDVLQGSTMPTALIISTWQKLAPLALLYMTLYTTPPNLLLMLGFLSITIGGWTGLLHTQTRKLMACSSIGHMGWLLVALVLNPKLATLTLMIYLLMTSAIFITLTSTEAKTITDIGTIWPHTPPQATLTAMTLLSLGGLPPMTGFAPKWLIIKDLTLHHLTPLATTLALLSLPALYFYVRLTYFTTLTTPPTTHTTTLLWRLPPQAPLTVTLPAILTIFMLPLMPTLYNTM